MTKILNQACDIKLGETSVCRIFVGSCLVWGGDLPCEFSVTPESTLIKQDGTPINIDIKCNTTWSCHRDLPCEFSVTPESTLIKQDGTPINIDIKCNTTWSCHIKDGPEVVPSLTVSPREITLLSSGGSQELTIQCNTTFKCYENN